MIRRLYLRNFRCFEELEIDFSERRTALVIGKNGSGKSTLVNTFKLLQCIGRGVNSVSDLAKIAGLATNFPDRTRIEVAASLGSRKFDYCLDIRLDFLLDEVIHESLSVDGKVLFTRETVEIALANVALPTIGPPRVDHEYAEKVNDYLAIDKFRKWLATLVVLSPIPSLMTGVSHKESHALSVDGANFATWLQQILSRYPAAYDSIAGFVKDVLPDYLDFGSEPIGEDGKRIDVRFGVNEESKTLPFSSLSDGEKCFFLCGAVVAANRVAGPILCLWDEPDNYFSLSEVGHVVMALRRSFEISGQLIITSHNPEAIRKFSDENTLCLNRKSHLDPPTARWLSDLQYHGDLIESLVRGDIDDGGQ